MTRPAAARKSAERRGRRAERFAALYLRAKGYAILAQRVRTPVGEIDLIARRGQVIAFIEVKQRPTLALALTAVPDQNWQRIARAGATWMARRRSLAHLDWRYDLIAVIGLGLPVHKRDFWRP